MKTIEELQAGYRIHIRPDPADPDFEWVSYRYPAAATAGGPNTPPCELTGLAAHRRWMRLLLARTQGYASAAMPGNSKLQKALSDLYKQWVEPDT